MNDASIKQQIKDIQILSKRQEEMFELLCNSLGINETNNYDLVIKWFEYVFNNFGDFEKLMNLTTSK